MKKVILLFLVIFFIGYANAQKFSFAVITDTHVRAQDSLAYNDLLRSIEQINQTSGLAFVLVTGDLTENGDRASLLKVKSALDHLKYKYYALSGNHETKWSESGSTDFGHIFGSERFAFEYNGFRFLGFATGPIIRMMDGHVAPQDIKWLKEELSAKPEQPTVIVTHYPLLPVDVDNWYEVTDVLRLYNIKAVIGGHYHNNQLKFYDGIPAFICRSNLRDKSDGLGGYSIFHINSDSILVSEQKIGEDLRQWGGYSLQKGKYYSVDNSDYIRPDYSVNSQYPNVEEVWLTENGNSIYSSPVVYKSHLYVGDDSGALSCYNLKDGSKKWDFQSGNRIIGTPAVANGIVVFGSADKNIYGINAMNGELRWKIETKEAVLGAVSIVNDIAYIGDSNHTMHAINIKNGQELWVYNKVEGYIETRPLIYNNMVIFGAWDSYLYALEKTTGKLLWKWQGEKTGLHYSPAAVWPVGANGKIFFTAPDRVMTVLDATTGSTIWRTSESMVRETIGLSADKERVYSKTMQDSVVCYSATGDTPKRLWSAFVGYGYDHAPSMPIEYEGIVYGSTKNGLIFAIEGKSGRLLWKHKIGNSIVNTVYPLSNNRCLFTSGDGKIGLLHNR